VKTVTAQSGLKGWRGHLQENYAHFAEFKMYSELYDLHHRLGYKTPKAAWNANPEVEGSVHPSDYRKFRP
jgi:hypothetical protein